MSLIRKRLAYRMHEEHAVARHPPRLLTPANSPCTPSARASASTDHAAPAVLSNTSIDFSALYPRLSTQVPSLSYKGDTAVQKFTVNPPDGKLIKFGKTTGHVVAIPANTLCDPTKNPYGPTEWLKPISFLVKSWTDAQGHAHADFSPDVRFNPAASAPVRIYFAETSLLSYSNVYIPFCTSLGACINESIGDSALTTYAAPHPSGGYWVYRMLRHFSGYNVTAF
jgi:hypothetical protein